MWLTPCSSSTSSARSASALDTLPSAAAPKITRLESCPVAPNGTRSIMSAAYPRPRSPTPPLPRRSWSCGCPYAGSITVCSNHNSKIDGFDSWLRADPVNRDDGIFLLDRLENGRMHDVIRADGQRVQLTVWPE